MKKTIFFLLCMIQLTAIAQWPQPTPEKLYRDGLAYLNGITKTYDPEKAKQLFYKSAELGNAQAMNALGNMYAKGITGNTNADSMVKWYNAAAIKGYVRAYFNLGQIYKSGTGVTQNFATAAGYFAKGNTAGDRDCKSLLAYMYYKGLGVKQSYNTAFSLYKQLADAGNTNAMYFIGLCYRNGYGTSVDKNEAKAWLQKASEKQDEQAMHELNEEMLPENISTVDQSLQHKLEELKKYSEKYQAATENNYEGSYTGFVVYYDWSGRYVSEIQPLKLTLQKTGVSYRGQWEEGDNNKAPVSLNVFGSRFSFDESSSYTRVNHYSNHKPELWQFNSAELQLGFVGDSTQLTGFVQFYSPGRKEPGKPLQVFLMKATDISLLQLAGVSKMALFPNPAQGQTTLQFTLSQSGKIAIQITSQTGSIVYRESQKLLPAGTYNYLIPVSNLPAASYNVSILVNGKIVATKLLVKQ